MQSVVTGQAPILERKIVLYSSYEVEARTTNLDVQRVGLYRWAKSRRCDNVPSPEKSKNGKGTYYLRLSLTEGFFIKSWKTSAVSTTMWMVETQLCKLRGTLENRKVEEFSDLKTYDNFSHHNHAMTWMTQIFQLVFGQNKLWKIRVQPQ